ncbi:hypothetical protein E0L36_20295 [Streptomyces sp. AJS327]|uniref:hypothetical protein n=1 Tax=Streptomyces sp. AJS327 TaxID=2545265 RepID=UPI0015DE5441|nr:hypothetical protein [Streptomyces sp. AJS327]MBA0053127.1 hypothetical protein [Streptomyces sp. AJS327]
MLLLATFACGGVAVWAASCGLKAKRCLDGKLHPDTSSASITERGCEITTTTGGTTRVPISGPSFEAGIASAAGFVVLGSTTTAVLVRRTSR